MHLLSDVNRTERAPITSAKHGGTASIVVKASEAVEPVSSHAAVPKMPGPSSHQCFRADRVAHHPHMPCTPGPGGEDAEQMYRLLPSR